MAKKNGNESTRIRLHKVDADMEKALSGEPEIHVHRPASGETPPKSPRHITRSFRKGERRHRYYPGDAPLDRVVYETATDELGRLHELFDSVTVVGDRAVIDLLEFEYMGERYPLEDCHTPEYGFIVSKKSIRAVPVPNGQGPNANGIIGGLIATNPVTGEPFTEDEQRSLKSIKVQLGKYSAKEPSEPREKNGGAPSPKVNRREFGVGIDDVATYMGNQSMAYVVKELAEMNFRGRAGFYNGSKISCRVLEVEYNGNSYKIERRTPVFKLVRHLGGMWAEPTSPEVSKYMCLGELFTTLPGMEGELSAVEQGQLRMKVKMESCSRTTTRSLRLGRMPFDFEDEPPKGGGVYR